MRKVVPFIMLCWGLVFPAQRPGAVFLMIWPGARATAMAGAFSAYADDATACYYNQAGLAFLDKTIATLQHANWLPGLHQGMYYEYLGVARPIRNGTLGLNVIYLTTGETQVINEQGNNLGTYTTFDIAVGLNYGLKLRPNLGLGLGWKFIYSFLFPDWVIEKMPELGIEEGGTGVTYAFDAGLLYKPFSFLSASTALQNFGPDISYTQSGSADPLPYTMRLGLKFTPLNTRIFKASLNGEVTKILVGMFAISSNTFFENIEYELREAWKSIGLELNYFDFAMLRGGYFYDYEGQRIGLTFGGGIKAGGFSIDVGVDENMYDFKTSNKKFSLTYQF